MDKPSIVNKFLQEGFLISPKVLDQLTEEKINQIMPTLKTKNVLVINELEEPEIAFAISKTEKKKSATVKYVIEYYNKKYSLLRTILSAKLNPVSINNLKPGSTQTIIGLVSEKTASGYMVEDPTSKTEIIYDKHLPPNAILAFTGRPNETKFFVTSVFYPDIPLDKKIKEPDTKLAFIFEKDKPRIIVNNEKEIKDFETPATITIKKNQETKILVYNPEAPFSKIQATESLKLRCLPEPKIPSTDYIISEEPDIFWIIQKENWTENYKGVKITSGESIEFEPKKSI